MSETGQPTLGIIAGAGQLPLNLAEACQASGRRFFILALEGAADIEKIDHLPHACVRLGAVGEALAHLKNADVQDIVMAGAVKRPSMSAVRPDATGARLIARLGLKLFSGDDALLKALVGFFEEEGFRVVGADDILGNLTTPEGVLTQARPDAQAETDIQLGYEAARALGALDIGQAVIVENGYVLGVEAAEGTEALIARCAPLAREKYRAVLVKVRKPGQDERADLPTIGAATLRQLQAAHMRGVAVEAGASLLLERAEAIRLANEHGLFIVGIK